MLYPKLFVLAALSSASAAFDPAKDTTCNDQGICLSSFIWCDQNGQACAYPEGTDALIPGSTAAPYAVLYHNVKYDLRWRQAQPGTDVLIEWLFDGSPFQEDGKSASGLPVMWSTNVTASATQGSFTFDPYSILKDFPTTHAPDVSPEHAASSASGVFNTIRISQPGTDFPGVYTDQFTVQSSWAHQLVKNIRQQDADIRSEKKRMWRLGVGIGVGVGVPLLSALVWWAGSRHGSSKATRSFAGK
ncbi:hypothetical protein QBC40DRAFT_216214 [Triangularia verruculosa]|uniref:Uncharacterized protein n=1 Tax=Triangularia verruculosa TaxID=2587418 RepID=A0AAN7AXE9_9PEZI|nr:hypothetical protein QBC40DRAFT_216214 [Triangularia verruculosa]